MKKIASVLLVIALLLASFACTPAKENAPINLKKGETVQLLANDVIAKLGDDASVEWTSSDEAVVTVDDGKITYVAEGTAVVTAKGTSADGKKTYASEFNVKCLSSDGAVKLDKYSLNFATDGDSATLTATLTDDTDRIKKWTSSDDSVATVVDGKVTRVSKGRAEITVETTLGYKATCYVMCDSVVMKLGGIEITDSMYAYWLASYKTQIVEYNIGYDSPEVWATEIDENGTTLEHMFKENVRSSINQMIEAIYVYYQSNDDVSEAIKAQVETQIAAAIDANGGEEALNKILSKFYADVELLRKIFIFEELTNYVYDGMFGENGTDKIDESKITEYFFENYMKAQHVFFDMNYKFDEEGNYSYLSETDILSKRNLAEDVWNRIQSGKLDYDEAVKQYSDDMEDTYDGFIFEEGDYDASFTDCVKEMKAGELKNFETSYGIHLIKKHELTEADLDDNTKALIEEMITMQIFDEKLSEYGESIEVTADIESYDVVNMPLFSSTEE